MAEESLVNGVLYFAYGFFSRVHLQVNQVQLLVSLSVEEFLLLREHDSAIGVRFAL